tara:strand:+ start:411 stop:776 length:366 start_codon:yes stop_codon:yes gene_type:complete
MKKQEFVPYEEAFALKKLGFDETTLGKYVFKELQIGGIWKDSVKSIVLQKAPLYQQAFRFFREEYGLVCGVRELCKGKYSFEIKRWEDYSFSSIGVDSWAMAELDCLRKLIEIVKENWNLK